MNIRDNVLKNGNEGKDKVKRRNLEKEYEIYFKEFFKNLKDRFGKLTYSKEIEEFSSGTLAVKNTMNSLPCSIDVIRIKVDTKKYEKAENDIYHLIKYDFSSLGKFSLRYHGEICLDEIENRLDVLKAFNLNQRLIEGLKTSELIGYHDPDQWDWVSVLFFDILESSEEHIEDFLFSFRMNLEHKIIGKFGKIDFNTKYDLKSDPIFPVSELLKKDEIFNSFFKIDNCGKHEITLEDLQKSICDIQLIPHVPEGVKRVFNAAKRLYIFGYFEYYFFTISQHYAFLALESALKNRYKKIDDSSRKFKSLSKIIKKLVERRIIPKEEEAIYDAGRQLRNALSHLTRPTIMTPNSTILKRVAYQINFIYDKE